MVLAENSALSMDLIIGIQISRERICSKARIDYSQEKRYFSREDQMLGLAIRIARDNSSGLDQIEFGSLLTEKQFSPA
jgi:hypothetical protein